MNPLARVEGDERLRLFCALLLPHAVVEGLVAWQAAELEGRELRVVAPGNLHVTLAFLGATTAARSGEVVDALREACAGRERPLFAVERYRETKSVAMIVLADEGAAERPSQRRSSAPSRNAISIGVKRAAGFRTSRSRAFATAHGSSRCSPTSAESLRPTRP